jgi:hypothetical protein
MSSTPNQWSMPTSFLPEHLHPLKSQLQKSGKRSLIRIQVQGKPAALLIHFSFSLSMWWKNFTVFCHDQQPYQSNNLAEGHPPL